MSFPQIVLLVEDSDDDRFFALRALKKAGFVNVRHVEDGQVAVHYLGGEGKYADRVAFPLPAVILLDLKIPELNGHQVLEWIDAQPNLTGCLAYILSSSGEQQDRDRAAAAHADGFFIKPLTQDNISEIIPKLFPE
jgi:CheY-like chemotaxis protein